MSHRISLHDCLDGAAVEDAARSAYREAHDRGLTLQGRLRQVVAVTEPLICAAERARLRARVKAAAVYALPPGSGPGIYTTLAVDMVPLDVLLNLLDADSPEDPMPDKAITIQTPRGEIRLPATRIRRDDDGLTVFDGDEEVAWFREGEYGGYHLEAADRTVTEGGHAA